MQIINDYIMKNLIYCEDTHSLIHRLFEVWKYKLPEDYNEAQNQTWSIISEMNKEELK